MKNKITRWLLSLFSVGGGAVALDYYLPALDFLTLFSAEQTEVQAGNALIEKEVPTLPLQDSIDLDLPEEEEDGWDSHWRSSDVEDSARKAVPPPPEGKRIGCICMDNEMQNSKGTGACSGRGGVRYWLYETEEGVMKHPYWRHLAHPQALTEQELANLSAHQERDHPFEQASVGKDIPGSQWPDVLIVALICSTVAYVTHTIWNSAKLH